MRRLPIPGETLHRVPHGNAYPHDTDRLASISATPVTVDRVARLYFWAGGKRYSIDRWIEVSVYPMSRLYETAQEWEDVRDRAVLCSKVRRCSPEGLTLDKLRRIVAVLEGV